MRTRGAAPAADSTHAAAGLRPRHARTPAAASGGLGRRRGCDAAAALALSRARSRRPPAALADASSSSAAASAGCAPSPSQPLSLPGPVVVIDNYDSFTYNLVQYLYDAGVPPSQLLVLKNDEAAASVDAISALRPAGVLISPGPGTPEESGVCLDACLHLGPRFPLFGVCMGHQCIGQAFGGRVVRAPTGLMHGKSSPVVWDDALEGSVLEGMASPFSAARYHSLVVDRSGLPACLRVTAWVDDGTIMGLRHIEFPWIQGVQFHPESIITAGGARIVTNWARGLASRTDAPRR